MRHEFRLIRSSNATLTGNTYGTKTYGMRWTHMIG
jgi:hypothetical protein